MNAVRSSNREKAENNRRTNNNQIENTHITNKEQPCKQTNIEQTETLLALAQLQMPTSLHT